MPKVTLHNLDWSKEKQLTRVILVSEKDGKWIFCKKKSKDTWEIPGGHIEEGESWLEAAKRELYEETGATEFDIKPICLYSISTYGILCYSNVKKLGKMPNFEMEKIAFLILYQKNYHIQNHTHYFSIK